MKCIDGRRINSAAGASFGGAVMLDAELAAGTDGTETTFTEKTSVSVWSLLHNKIYESTSGVWLPVRLSK